MFLSEVSFLQNKICDQMIINHLDNKIKLDVVEPDKIGSKFKNALQKQGMLKDIKNADYIIRFVEKIEEKQEEDNEEDVEKEDTDNEETNTEEEETKDNSKEKETEDTNDEELNESIKVQDLTKSMLLPTKSSKSSNPKSKKEDEESKENKKENKESKKEEVKDDNKKEKKKVNSDKKNENKDKKTVQLNNRTIQNESEKSEMEDLYEKIRKRIKESKDENISLDKTIYPYKYDEDFPDCIGITGLFLDDDSHFVKDLRSGIYAEIEDTFEEETEGWHTEQNQETGDWEYTNKYQDDYVEKYYGVVNDFYNDEPGLLFGVLNLETVKQIWKQICDQDKNKKENLDESETKVTGDELKVRVQKALSKVFYLDKDEIDLVDVPNCLEGYNVYYCKITFKDYEGQVETK